VSRRLAPCLQRDGGELSYRLGNEEETKEAAAASSATTSTSFQYAAVVVVISLRAEGVARLDV
jgi:hypothetical protein